MPMMKTAGYFCRIARLALLARQVRIHLQDLLGVEERQLLGEAPDTCGVLSFGNISWAITSRRR